MAFNKQKTLESAQRFLNQGKIPEAITEYQQILRHEPKDLVTLMTVGDLFVRSGDTKQALEYFEKLGQLYLGDGFTSKAIAIYKKIAKLAPEEIHPLERLAELYVQQGVMSEARPLFLQIAETYLKTNQQQQAVSIFRKLLELEPDNARVQLRLAELYQAIGQPGEGATAYLSSAHRIFDRGDFLEANKMADRALHLQPKNVRALLLKARATAALGKKDAAIQLLEGLEETKSSAEATRVLCDLYVQTGKSSRAVELAKKIHSLSPANCGVVFEIAASLIDAREAEAGLSLLGQIREAMIGAGDQDRAAQAISSAAEQLPGRPEPLEWLVEIYRRTNDTVRLPDALDRLAEACVAVGNLSRARDLFQELVTQAPEDENNLRRLKQVRQKLGEEPAAEVGAPPAPAAEQAVPFAAEMTTAPPVPVVEAVLDEETQHALTQALTDADLFSTYGLTPKAIDLLESMVARAPGHVVLLEKLLDLHLGAGNDRRTAELAGLLEQIHNAKGDMAQVERFSQLRRRFQRAAGLTAEEMPVAPPPVAEFKIPGTETIPETQAEPAGASEVHEVDLSQEWAVLSEQATEPVEAPPAVEAKPAEPPAAAVPAVPVAEGPPSEEYELELTPAAPPAPTPAKAETTGADFLAGLAAEVEGLEIPSAPAGPATPPKVTAAAKASAPAQSVDQLKEVFDEFRSELGEMGEEAEDPETHYNLGIAYREMGLLEEAIGEFQKVAKTIQKGVPFRYAMQCCTLLGLSFMDKGQADIAAMWYQRALQTPGLDQETILALRYDLGVAQEAAGDLKGALNSFNQVYAMNIDYRDVAERIAALQKAQ